MLFRTVFDVLDAPRVQKGQTSRKVQALGTDPSKVEVRRQIKQIIADSCEVGLEHIRLRSIVAQSPESLYWNEDEHGPDDIGIKISAEGKVISGGAPVEEKKPVPIPTREEILAVKRTKDELLALASIFAIPAEKIPAGLAGKNKTEVAAFFADYFHPPVKPAENTGGEGEPAK